jgi:hypothetical protein
LEQSARGGDRPAVVQSMSELYGAWDEFKAFLAAGPSSPEAAKPTAI